MKPISYNNHSKIHYKPEIDGLRAIAVTLVVVYHAFPSFLTGGFVGVDVFFVISGYLITSILQQEILNKKYSIKEFYRRRVDRLFPSLLLMLFSVYIFGWFALFADEYMQLGKQIAGGSSFIANIVLYSGTGYFDSSSNVKPLLHLWSLGIEEQFYLILPLLLSFLYIKRLNIFFSLLIITAISFLLNIYTINTNVEKTFYLPQYRAWELLCGSLIAIIIQKYNWLPKERYLSNFLSILGVSLIISSSILLTPEINFPGWYAALPVFGAIFVIIAGQQAMLNRIVLSSKTLVFIGLISYPLYLWHWPLISISNIINGNETSNFVRFILIILSFTLAIITYIFIERPLHKLKSWRKKTIPMLILMIIIGATGYITYENKGIYDRNNIKISDKVSAQLNGAMWKYTNNDICESRFNFNESSNFGWWFCMLKRNENPDILLLGNSYANHLYPGIAESNKLKDLNVLSIGISDVTAAVEHKENTLFKKENDYINSIIKHTPSIKYVIISGISENPSDDYIEKLSKRIRIIEESGKKVIVFTPHVKLNFNIKACFSRPFKKADSDCETDLKEVSSVRNNFSVLMKSIHIKHSSVLFFDPNSLICGKNKCSSVRNGMPIYRDNAKHLSVFASKELGDIFAEWAKNNVPDIVK
ncbi:acyltransferase family protein [Xenorhabdus bovienii]|uniref:acyltransferase family protein n=1 Tax=Xenorhabdus bovienii TaxID=40576 RepID=UPI0023B26541|nr:acyltransferase family protein [Xenorhabdus bovienii]MDE9544335.1 acyltransferase [Xenorhabdus bovienii]